MTDPGYVKEFKYQQGLAYENVLTNFIGYIANLRVNDPRKYAAGVETFILMCPNDIRQQGFERLENNGLSRGNYQHISTERMLLYDDLWVFINNVLEENNMIFKTSYIKTYE